MPVTTKPIDQAAVKGDVFAQQLEAMLAGIGEPEQPATRSVTMGEVSLDEVLVQANEGISLAQIVEATMQDAGQLLADLYYELEAAAQNTSTNFVDLNNQIRLQLDKLEDLFVKVTFKDQALFQNPSSHHIPTGFNKADKITLSIPNTSLNQLGLTSWQMANGPILPRKEQNTWSFRFENLQLQSHERVRLNVGEADVLQDCVGSLYATMQTVADLINQAELDWLNQAIINNGELSIQVTGVDQASLMIEAPTVAVEDSLAAIQVEGQQHCEKAMQVIVSAIGMLADYRDVAVAVGNELHQAVMSLMSAPPSADMNAPLAKAMVKDVQSMLEQQPAKSLMAQANLED